MSLQISESEQEQLVEKLEVFKIKGKDKRGRKILRVIGKFFPANETKGSAFLLLLLFFFPDSDL